MIRTPAWSKGGIRRQETRKNKDAAECQVKVNRLGSESKPENRHILFFFFFFHLLDPSMSVALVRRQTKD